MEVRGDSDAHARAAGRVAKFTAAHRHRFAGEAGTARVGGSCRARRSSPREDCGGSRIWVRKESGTELSVAGAISGIASLGISIGGGDVEEVFYRAHAGEGWQRCSGGRAPSR